MARIWTEEHKTRQAVLIHRWQPWTRSTGARTPQGKAISSRNVLVGNANRAAALEQARQELKTVELRIMRLSRGKENPWLDRVIAPSKR